MLYFFLNKDLYLFVREGAQAGGAAGRGGEAGSPAEQAGRRGALSQDPGIMT